MDDSLELLIVTVTWLACGVINHRLSDRTYDDSVDAHWVLIGAGYMFSPAITTWYVARALGVGIFAAIELIFYEEGREALRKKRHQRALLKEHRKLEVQQVVNRRIELETEAVKLQEHQAGLVRID